ncbi:beta family protein [Azospirillum picis]|uniref:Beta protein n=1 Tax=Azospirillum picis TaxID=488438 RepID=A0ABU0MVU6_9PROT|nr:beta family protein [Azospirillum picis]MBP2303613.1 hypothetical protein [Azospirillum picis]MDQ0537454.1 hypothetical protein [Azospirillum picis]
MFDHKHYTPIIKWKRGERFALENLRDDQLQSITPLVEIPPFQWNPNASGVDPAFSARLSAIPPEMNSAIRGLCPLFLDFSLIDQSASINGISPITWFFTAAHQYSIKAIPVVRLYSEANFVSDVRHLLASGCDGVCVRIRIEEANRETLSIDLPSLLNSLGVKCENVDIVFDWGNKAQSEADFLAFIGLLTILPEIKRWRTLTIAAGSFPSELKPGPGVFRIPRNDWLFWKGLVSQSEGLSRIPAFADYGIANPLSHTVELPENITLSAKIIYTIDKEWLLIRGGALYGRFAHPRRYEQYRDICKQIVSMNGVYRGPEFSHGDNCINECAQGHGTTGSPTTWVTNSLNAHIAFVVNCIANLDAI